MSLLSGLYDADIMGNTVLGLVRRRARTDPDAANVIFEDRVWTYRALVDTAEAAAAGLQDIGVGPGDRVAFLGRNSDVYVIGWLATLIAGAVHVPMNFMLNERELAYIIGHAQPTAAFADDALYPALTAAVQLSSADAHVGVLNHQPSNVQGPQQTLEGLWGRKARLRPVELTGETIAQIAYTSGTESAPKGAMLSHRALISEYMSCIVAGDYSPRDVVVHALPLYHCAQMHCFLMPCMALGATNVVVSSAAPDEILDAVERHEATSVFAPPTVWIGLLQNQRFDECARRSLQKGYYGAAIMPVEVLKELAGRAPGVRLWNYYGQTEISPLATALDPSEQLTRLGSAGKPVLNVETRVVDDQMTDVKVGEIGEVVHRSPQLFSGYYHDPERTAEAFGGGWFHSGDLARVDEDGYLYIVDRKKDVINTGGENVSSREVEDALYSHPAVAEIAVVGRPDARWIERVCAVVVPRPGEQPTSDELIAHARRRLSAFKVPKEVVFVDELPKNPSGKILKRELREMTLPGSEPGRGPARS